MAAAAPPAGMPHRGWTLLTVCLGAFMATLDTSIVSIALPQMARDLGASLAAISWVMMAYLITNASLLLSSSRLGDMLAPGRLFLGGITIFGLASIVCGLSSQTWTLVAARAVQGLGASLMLGVAPKIITTTYGEGERGLPLGLFSTAFATGVTVGAPLGGFITSAWGWPMVFFINPPICLGALLLGGRFLLRLRPETPWEGRSFDWQGGTLFFVSVSLLMWALTQVRTQGWLDVKIVVALGGAGAAFLFLLIMERRQTMPLLHGELWRNPDFYLGSTTVVLTFAAVMGTFFLLPFYLEGLFGLPPKTVGWLLAVLSFSNALVSPLGGFYADRWNNLLVLRLGAFLVVGGLCGLLWLGPSTSLGLLVFVFALTGVGFGMFQAPNLNEMLRGVRTQMLGLAAGTNAVLKNLGSLLGIALMVTMAALGDRQPASPATGQCLEWPCFQRAFAAAALLAALNALVNLLPRQRLQRSKLRGRISVQKGKDREKPSGP
ncbi:MAG: MFS transporter [Deltaproteobacteria bacterium]|nr:MFS transporter [Deltaproteobacteria bacterium]